MGHAAGVRLALSGPAADPARTAEGLPSPDRADRQPAAWPRPGPACSRSECRDWPTSGCPPTRSAAAAGRAAVAGIAAAQPRPAAGAAVWSGSARLGWTAAGASRVLELDLSGAAGHVAVVGAPQSGKSTAVRTLICALALTHGPDELVGLLPGSGRRVAGRADRIAAGRRGGRPAATGPGAPDRGDGGTRPGRSPVRRPAAAGVTGVAEWRRTAAAGGGPAVHEPVVTDGFGDLLLVVDGWATLARESFELLEARLTSIAARGLNYGVHLALTAGPVG